MSHDRTHYFYVKPLTPEANEAITEWLNARGKSASSREHQTIVVDGLSVEGVYEVQHIVLTELLRSVHKHNVRAYVQESGGKIRLYRHYSPQRARLGRTKAVRAVQEAVKKIART